MSFHDYRAAEQVIETAAADSRREEAAIYRNRAIMDAPCTATKISRADFLRKGAVFASLVALPFDLSLLERFWKKLSNRFQPKQARQPQAAVRPRRYAEVRTWGRDFSDTVTQREILTTGLYGHLYSADVHVSRMTRL